MKVELPVELDGGPFTIATEGLVKRFGPVTALDSVDLRVPSGAVYVLVGPNGAGKSTLLRTLLNVVRRDAGEVRVLGIDPEAGVSGEPEAGGRHGSSSGGAMVRAQIGYVPERHDAGHPWLTVGRLLERHAAFYPTWDGAYADRLADALEVDRERKCGVLSKGQSRRVQILLALAHRPPVLLMDEPGDGLDHYSRDLALELLIEHLADSPATVLISTHRVDEFERLIDHVGVLRNGTLVGQMTRQRFQRTLCRYRADVPAAWDEATDLEGTVLRRAGIGREIDWTVWGERDRVVERLTRSGATVRDIVTLSLDEAATTLLSRRQP